MSVLLLPLLYLILFHNAFYIVMFFMPVYFAGEHPLYDCVLIWLAYVRVQFTPFPISSCCTPKHFVLWGVSFLTDPPWCVLDFHPIKTFSELSMTWLELGDILLYLQVTHFRKSFMSYFVKGCCFSLPPFSLPEFYGDSSLISASPRYPLLFRAKQ